MTTKTARRNRINKATALFVATLKAGYKPKPKLDPAVFAQRFAREQIAQQGRYCVAFAPWRSCRHGECRRHHCCFGDAGACLKRALGAVPHRVQWRTRQRILDATPANIGAPERKARQSMPRDCCG
jgi:hypothetical protein